MFTLQEIGKIVEKGIYSLDLKGEPKRLYDPIEYIVSIGGKRIRPKLSVLTYSLFSDDIDMSVMLPSLGLEIFHAFTLIHDDIMDKADMRRGQPTIHKKWNDNIAILSGDTMCIKAYQLICKANPQRLPAILELFNDTATKVCEGQQYDMDYETMPVVTMEDYIKMTGLKTAVLLACSAKMGALLAGAEKKFCDAIYEYGYKLGIAFQITDDYLDTFGDPSVFGKNIGGDIVNGKKTWLYINASTTSSGSDKERFNEIMSWGTDRACEKIAAAKEFFTSIGIKERAEKEIEKYFRQAIDAICNIGLENGKVDLLEEFATMITYRKK